MGEDRYAVEDSIFAALAGTREAVSAGRGAGRVSSAEDVSEELREAGGGLGPSEASTERARELESWSTSTSPRQMAAVRWQET